MKNVYVLLDNDMENCTVNTDVYSTYEKAEKVAKEIIQELKDQYDELEKSDEYNSWLFIDDDSVTRSIEIKASTIK